MTILHDYCGYTENCHSGNRFMKVDWLRGLITVECMTIMCLFSYYIIKMREFNRLQMPPDGKEIYIYSNILRCVTKIYSGIEPNILLFQFDLHLFLVLRESYMRALRNNLVLRFDEQRPIIMNTNRTTQEVTNANKREEEAYQNHPIILAQNDDSQSKNIRTLQAELIRFLIRQIKRKNKKLVALTQQIADQNT